LIIKASIVSFFFIALDNEKFFSDADTNKKNEIIAIFESWVFVGRVESAVHRN